MKRILVTGSAGFIGFHMSERLLSAGHEVVGLDAMTDYYDVSLKEARHDILRKNKNFHAVIENIENTNALFRIFEREKPEIVIHLAAQAGVRYSIDEPDTYVRSNLVGGFNILEATRRFPVEHLLFASTSSVYGANEKMPFEENDPTRLQMSFYAATKKSNEAMAHSYSHLYNIPTTMFRFFTVYGPWGRPDMALFKFTKAILSDEPIDVYNNGEMSRDFTYIDDITAAIEALVTVRPDRPVFHDSLSPVAPWRVVNIGNGNPTKLMDFIEALEVALEKKAEINFLPMQKGDVYNTWAKTDLLQNLTKLKSQTPLEEGIGAFVRWYREYYKV